MQNNQLQRAAVVRPQQQQYGNMLAQMPQPPTGGTQQQSMPMSPGVQKGINPPPTTMPMPPGNPGFQPVPGTQPPPPPGNTAMNPAPGQYSQWGNNPQPVGPPNPATPTPPPPDPSGTMPPPPGVDVQGGQFNPGEKNVYGNQQIAGADPQQADYQSVQQFSDAAHQEARKYLDPQQAQDSRRFDQELINKGIDPRSDMGQQMSDQMARQHGDQDRSAAFGAMQFGQGIQNQMSQQEQQKAQLAGNMQQALWQNQLGGQQLKSQTDLGRAGLGMQQYGIESGNAQALARMGMDRYGMDQNFALGQAGLDNARYGMDQGFQLGMGNLDLQRGGQEHGQMMDFLNYDMGVNQYNQQQQMIQDAMFNQQYGNVPIPGMGATNPYSPAGTMLGAGDTTWWSGGGSAGIGF